MTQKSLFRTITAATAVLAVTATLAACGGGGGSDATDTTRVKNNAFTTVPSDGGSPTTLFDWTGGSSTTVEGSTDTTVAPGDTTAPTDSAAPTDSTAPVGETTVPAAGDTTLPPATAGEAISLVQSKGQSGDAFGGAVVLSTDGSTLAVGALYADVNGNADQGSVTVFTRSGGSWAEQGVLTIEGAANDWFGYSIAMSSDGGTIAVGAVYATVNGNKAQGSASVFARQGGKWSLQKTVTGKDGAGGDPLTRQREHGVRGQEAKTVLSGVVADPGTEGGGSLLHTGDLPSGRNSVRFRRPPHGQTQHRHSRNVLRRSQD